MPIEQGEIYNFDFGPQKGSSMEGPHPALVIQTDKLNRIEAYSLVIIVPISSKGKEQSPSHVRIEATGENGLDHVSFAKCEQIYTVERPGLSERLGKLSKQDLFRVKAALKIVLDLSG